MRLQYFNRDNKPQLYNNNVKLILQDNNTFQMMSSTQHQIVVATIMILTVMILNVKQ